MPREAPPSTEESQAISSKHEQLEIETGKALAELREHIERIEAFMQLESATESNYDRAIGHAIRIKNAVRLAKSHVTAMCRTDVVMPKPKAKKAGKPKDVE